MKKRTLCILLAFAAAAEFLMLALTFARVSDLENQLRNTRSELTSRISNIQDAVYGISNNVEEKLEEQTNQLSSFEWEYGTYDGKSLTVPVIFTAVPKEYTPGVTEAVLVFDGKEYPMTASGAKYTVSVDVPVFSETNSTLVMLKDGDTVRTQQAECYFSPRYDFIPYVFCDFGGTVKGGRENDIYKLNINGEFFVEMDGYDVKKQPYGIDKVVVTEYVEGNVTERKELSLIPGADGKFTDGLTHHVGEYKDTGLVKRVHFSMNKTVDVPLGGKYEVCVEVTDMNGFVFKSIPTVAVVNDEGNDLDLNHDFFEAEIYTTDGKLLYSPY